MQEVAAAAQAPQKIDAGFRFGHFTVQGIHIGIEYAIVVRIQIDLEYGTGQLVIGIRGGN